MRAHLARHPSGAQLPSGTRRIRAETHAIGACRATAKLRLPVIRLDLLRQLPGSFVRVPDVDYPEILSEETCVHV